MKKRLRRVLGVVLGAPLLAALGGLAYMFVAYPQVGGAPDLTVEVTPERLERGRYLAEHAAACTDCHSQRDWSRYSGPVVAGTEGQGGETFTGSFGVLYAPNITPAALGHWSDGDLHRAITAGVSRGRRPLFPLMPYHAYGRADAEDINAIIAYLRSLPPIEHAVPRRKLRFPLGLVVRTMPTPGVASPRPDPADTVAHGAYMYGIAACADCHTPQERGVPLPGKEHAGGFAIALPDGRAVRSANITPDERTGIGLWSREAFVTVFKARAVSPEIPPEVRRAARQTVMPWSVYAGMTEADLGAIYDYLRTVAPVEHEVDTAPFVP